MDNHSFLAKIILLPFGGSKRQAGNAIFYALLVSSGLLSTLAFVRMKSSNMLDVSYTTRSKVLGTYANDQAAKVLTQLMEYHKIVLCGHSLAIGATCNSNGKCAPDVGSVVCAAGENGWFKMVGNEPAGVPLWGDQWDFVPGNGTGTFRYRTCDTRSLGADFSPFGSAGNHPYLSSCNTVETTIQMQLSASGNYVFGDVRTPVSMRNGEVIDMTYRFRMPVPNKCGGVHDDHVVAAHGMTAHKQPIVISSGKDFAKIHSGGYYVLNKTIRLDDWDGDSANDSDGDSDDDAEGFTKPGGLRPPYLRTPLKNVIINGKGNKIVSDNIIRDDSSDVGIFSAMDCSVITDLEVLHGDDDDSDPNSDARGLKGEKCVGGVLGSSLGGVVLSNLQVETRNDLGYSQICGREDVGGVVGCVQPGFFGPGTTTLKGSSVDALTKVRNNGCYGDKVDDDADDDGSCAGNGIGQALGGTYVKDFYSSGEVIAIFNKANLFGVGGVVGCGGSNNDTDSDDDDNVPLVVDGAKSESGLYDCTDTNLVNDDDDVCQGQTGTASGGNAFGGIVGSLRSGRVTGFALGAGIDPDDADADDDDSLRAGRGSRLGVPSIKNGTALEQPGIVFGYHPTDDSLTNEGNDGGGIVGRIMTDGGRTHPAAQISDDQAPNYVINENPTQDFDSAIIGNESRISVIGMGKIGGIIGAIREDGTAGGRRVVVRGNRVARSNTEIPEIGSWSQNGSMNNPNQPVGGIVGHIEDNAGVAAVPVDVSISVFQGQTVRGTAKVDCFGGQSCDGLWPGYSTVTSDVTWNGVTSEQHGATPASNVPAVPPSERNLTAAQIAAGSCPITSGLGPCAGDNLQGATNSPFSFVTFPPAGAVLPPAFSGFSMPLVAPPPQEVQNY